MSTSDIYTDASELGHVKTTIGLILGVIVSLILISIGVYLTFFDRNPHTKEVSAIISKVMDCNSSYDKHNIHRVDCDVLIHYDYEGKSYDPITPVHTTDGYHVIGGPITIYIDPKNPVDYSMASLNQEKLIGWTCTGIGIIVLLISMFTWWLSYRYKAFAALQGVGFGLGGLSSQNTMF